MFSGSDNPGYDSQAKIDNCAVACMSHKTPVLEGGSVGNYGGSVWPDTFSAAALLL